MSLLEPNKNVDLLIGFIVIKHFFKTVMAKASKMLSRLEAMYEFLKNGL